MFRKKNIFHAHKKWSLRNMLYICNFYCEELVESFLHRCFSYLAPYRKVSPHCDTILHIVMRLCYKPSEHGLANIGLDYRDRGQGGQILFLKSVSESNHTAVIRPRCAEMSTVCSWPICISINRCSAIVASPEGPLSLGRYLGPKRPLSTYIDPRTRSVRMRVREAAAVTGVRCSLPTPEISWVVNISIYPVRTCRPQLALRLGRDTCAPCLSVTSNVHCSLSSHPGLLFSLK
jgi:hypothetical protein